MKLDGRFRIPAPREAVFERLNDPQFFASCLEGVHDLHEIDEDNYTAMLETRIAFINFKFDVEVNIRERVAPERVVVRLEGTPKGMVGRLTSTAVAALVEAEGGRETDILYEMEVALTGKLGSLGQPVMKSKAKDMERGFVRRASAAFAPAIAAPEGAAPRTPQLAPSATEQVPSSPGAFRLWIARIMQALATRVRGESLDPASAVAVTAAPLAGTLALAPVAKDGSATRSASVRRGRLDFELVRPSTLGEAIRLLDTEDPTVRPYSGGTALMLMMKSGVFSPTQLVDLSGLEGDFGGISVAGDGLSIGSLTTLATLGTDGDIARLAPVITRAIPRLSNVRVRNAARVGGCVAHGDPHMDLPPILACLRGAVEIEGPTGRRVVAVEDLYTGYYQTVLEKGELIAAVRLPIQTGWRSVYRKTTVRTYDDWPALGVAASARLDEGVVGDIRLVVSAATEKVTRLAGIEAMLNGALLDEKMAARAGEYAAETVETLDDVQGTAAYKRLLVEVEVRRALLALLDMEAVA